MPVVALVLVLVLISFVFGPMLTLWAVNTISEAAGFGWQIPHGLWTYLAVWVLLLVWKSSTTTTGKK